jgi:hydrogenase expression/formation protein HypC
MCLGIPGRIVSISDPARMLALVEISGIRREVNVVCVAPAEASLEALIGTWVLIHVGFAMSCIDEEEAQKTLEILHQLGEAQAEIEAMRGSAA